MANAYLCFEFNRRYFSIVMSVNGSHKEFIRKAILSTFSKRVHFNEMNERDPTMKYLMEGISSKI